MQRKCMPASGATRTPEELMQDIDKVLSFVPGRHKLNLHANYAIFEEGEHVDRDAIEPKHFARWVEFAEELGCECVMNIWVPSGTGDSDHVVLFDDETKEIAKEIVRNDVIDRVKVGLDFFDASINRISAWTVGMRNYQKALLYALLSPNRKLAALQEEGRLTEVMMLQEEVKTYPFGAVWDYFCESSGVPVREAWYKEVEEYEKTVLAYRV